MDWIKPKYSKSDVNKAGEIIKNQSASAYSKTDKEWANEVMSNWRSSHIYPLNTFNATLRDKLRKLEPDALIAQRLKRAESIINKLLRFPSMNLARMQDIGGLRAIVSNIEMVEKLKNDYEGSTRIKHELVNIKDYITQPKKSGYRGIHLNYKYKNVRASEYSDLRIELQIRSKIQHAWATGVETIGTFIKTSLKSSEGPDEWLNFFAVAGAAFAFLEQSSSHTPSYEGLSKKEIFQKTVSSADNLKVEAHLKSFTIATTKIAKEPGMYHLIILDLRDDDKPNLNIESFSKKHLTEASNRYAEIEKEIASGQEKQAVLVSAGKIKDLEKAYPNYFLDTKEFLNNLSKIRDELAKL